MLGSALLRFAAVLMALVGCPASVLAADDRPNIVLIISDDHDYEHFGFMGHSMTRMPTIDRLAAEGSVFPVAHGTMSRCRPSLAALLCGRYPHQTGIYFNYSPSKQLLSTENSLAEILKQAGYATFAQGKYWEGDAHRLGFTHGPGRDYDFVRRDQNAALDFLDSVGGQPFFMWYAPRIPHQPHDPPAKYTALVDPTAIQAPQWFHGIVDEFRRREHLSFAMEAWLDDAIAQLLAKLRERGLDRKTMVILMVDNGWSNGLVSKGSPFEKGVRTPIVVHWPGKVPAGKRFAQLAHNLDVMPTILDYAGLPIPQACAGQSLRPILEGKQSEWRDTLYGAIYPGESTAEDERPERDVYALYARTDRWKYVLYLQDVREERNQRYFRIQHILTEFPRRDRGDQDLYDLSADPYELHDLAGRPEQAERLAALHRQVLDWWRSTGGKPIEGFSNK